MPGKPLLQVLRQAPGAVSAARNGCDQLTAPPPSLSQTQPGHLCTGSRYNLDQAADRRGFAGVGGHVCVYMYIHVCMHMFVCIKTQHGSNGAITWISGGSPLSTAPADV